MSNHVHLLIERRADKLGRIMHRILTGYSQSYNRRYQRTGHFLQGRHKAVLCQSERYLAELVSHVHLYSQYSGYLRRDSDIDGFIFWLNQVSAAPPRNVDKQHGMVCAFITSAEYQLRFGNTTPRTNAECVP